jgi:hypothetical protein
MKTIEFSKTLLIVLATLFVLILVVPSDPINTFGYHSWRQTQTYVPYDCFSNGNAETALYCFIAPPVLGGDHFVGLEAPIFQFVQAILNPGNEPTQVSNILPALSVVFLGSMLMYMTYSRLPSIIGLILGGSLCLSFIRSPTTQFFVEAFHPAYFACALMVGGMILLFSSRNNSATRSVWGLSLVALSIASMPQVILIAGSIMFMWSLKRSPLRHRFKLDRTMWFALVAKTIFASLLVAIPYGTYHLVGQWYLNQGWASPYPKWPITIDSLTHSDFWPQFVDQIGMAGVGFALICMFLIIASLVHNIRASKFLVCIAIGGPLLAYLATFILLFHGFWANTYYGYMLILSLIVSLYASLYYSIITKQMLVAFNKKSAVFAAIAIGFACLPADLVDLTGRSWRSTWVYRQLANGSVQCDPEIAERLIELHTPRNIRLDCDRMDPTCRTATRRRGTNLPHVQLARPGVVRAMNEQSSFYLTCLNRSHLDRNEELNAIFEQNSSLIDEQGEWRLYQFGHSTSALERMGSE